MLASITPYADEESLWGKNVNVVTVIHNEKKFPPLLSYRALNAGVLVRVPRDVALTTNLEHLAFSLT